MEYVLLAILLVCALIIVVAVLFQKSGDKGLSGTISGNSETYYGKDKTGGREQKLFKWTLVASIVFAVAVVAVYIIQPDYEAYSSYNTIDAWQTISDFADIFKAN